MGGGEAVARCNGEEEGSMPHRSRRSPWRQGPIGGVGCLLVVTSSIAYVGLLSIEKPLLTTATFRSTPHNRVKPEDSPSPLHWWKADGNTNDAVGTANGTLVGGTYGPGSPGGPMGGQAFMLDGTDDYVNIPSSAMSGVADAISATAWVNPTSISQGGTILSQYDTYDSETSFILELRPGGQIVWSVVGPDCNFSTGSDVIEVTTDTSIPVNQWSH